MGGASVGVQEKRSNMWTRGLVPAGLALILAGLLAFHRYVPNAVGNLGSLMETFLPWLGWLIIPLAAWAFLRRSATAGIALAIPVLTWGLLFAELLPDKSDGDHDLRVLTHNVDADNTDPQATMDTVIGADADVVALEELADPQMYDDMLSKEYPYSAQEGTVGLWSRYEITGITPVDINIGWTRAVRAQVNTDSGPVAIYVAHLASVRVGSEGFTSQRRDDTAQALGTAISNESLEQVVLLGDLNGTMQDRSLAPVTHQLESAQAESGAGFGFTWPAPFPMTRIDQILVRGLVPVNSWTLERTGSDHLPIAADLRW